MANRDICKAVIITLIVFVCVGVGLFYLSLVPHNDDDRIEPDTFAPTPAALNPVVSPTLVPTQFNSTSPPTDNVTDTPTRSPTINAFNLPPNELKDIRTTIDAFVGNASVNSYTAIHLAMQPRPTLRAGAVRALVGTSNCPHRDGMTYVRDQAMSFQAVFLQFNDTMDDTSDNKMQHAENRQRLLDFAAFTSETDRLMGLLFSSNNTEAIYSTLPDGFKRIDDWSGYPFADAQTAQLKYSRSPLCATELDGPASR
jgi:hypothetical protein